MPIRRQKIKSLTEELLSDHAVQQAPVPIFEIVEMQGIDVHFDRLEGDMSGFLYRSGNEVVIGVNTQHSRTRQSFTVAHELGHFMLHDQEQLHIDRDFKVRLRDNKSSLGFDDDEREANHFAANLLMPEAFIENDLADEEYINVLHEDYIRKLAKKYGVSSQAFINRLKNLGYICD